MSCGIIHLFSNILKSFEQMIYYLHNLVKSFLPKLSYVVFLIRYNFSILSGEKV